ncbi:Pyridoxine 5'-phosphate synthase [Arsenophonus endosymbiont of Bemisia tabaci Q2]|nr:Pyridoxine 5'-phosphate synthase [Arsenophonus endosymbiont of Bemisia tabaci Q2]
MFIDPKEQQIDAAVEIGTPFIEIHTGAYADAKSELKQQEEFKRIKQAISYATEKKIKVNAGHGLTYHNVQRIPQLPDIYELNIGHAIIGRALFSGMATAVTDMKKILREARC